MAWGLSLLGGFAGLSAWGDDLLVEAGDGGGDRRPVIAAAGVGGGLSTAPAPLVRVGGGLEQGCRQCRFVVGGHEPAALAVADDLGGPVRGAGDDGQAAG